MFEEEGGGKLRQFESQHCPLVGHSEVVTSQPEQTLEALSLRASYYDDDDDDDDGGGYYQQRN